MRKTLYATLAATALVATGAIAQTGGRPLSTDLNGAEEVPGPGDPDGTGQARITVNPGKQQVCYTLRVRNIASATGAHIHEAPEGEAGPVVVPLIPPASGTSSGCATVTRELSLEILRNPSDYYVNIHNMQFPAGAVRGQLSK